MKKLSCFVILICFFIFFMAFTSHVRAAEQASVYEQLQNDRTGGGQSIQSFGMPSEGGTISIFIRVVDAQTKLPVNDFFGDYHLEKGGYIHDFNENSKDGITEIDGLRNEAYKFKVSGKGYDNDVRTMDISGLSSSLKRDHSSVSPSESAYNDDMNFYKQKPYALTFELYPAKGKAKGMVIDALTKEPLPAAEIIVNQDGVEIPILTNDKGVFQIEGLRQLPDNDPTEFSVTKKGYVEQEWGYAKAGLSEKNLEFALIPMGGIEGLLYDYSGKPVENQKIFLSTKDNFESIKGGFKGIKHYENVVSSDSKGNFKFEDIKPGKYVLLYGPSNEDIQEVTVNSAENKNISLKQHLQEHS